MKNFILLSIGLLLFYSCGTKNPTIRDTVKKKIADSQTIGVEEFKKGNYASAKLFLDSALKDAYSIDNVDGILIALQNLAEVQLKLGNYVESSNDIFRAKLISEQEGISNNYSVMLTLGKYYDKTGDYGTALNYYDTALQNSRNDLDRALIYNSMGITRIKQKNFTEAAALIKKAKEINESQQAYDAVGDNYFNLGDIDDQNGSFDSAIQNFQLALKNDKIAEKSDGIIEDLKRIGIEYSKSNRKDLSLYYLIRARNTADSMGYKEDSSQIQKLIDSINGNP